VPPGPHRGATEAGPAGRVRRALVDFQMTGWPLAT
jgi:hypothetical protein